MGRIFTGKLYGTRGTAALEFGLAMPFLLALTIGLTEAGMMSYQAMQARDAAETGALYASQHPSDMAGITSAVLTATGTPGISATPVPASFCGCPTVTGITPGDCSSTLCLDGSPQSHYVRVSVSLTHMAIVKLPGFANPLVLTAKSTLRVQ